MPSQYNNCDIDVTPPVCDPCLSNKELGGIRGVAFIHSSIYNEVLANAGNAAIWDMYKGQGLIFIIPQTRGTFDGGSVISQPGFGSKATVNVGYDFSLEYDDPAYSENCAFYNQIAKSGMYHVAFLTETMVKISGKTVDIVPTAPIDQDVNVQAVWHIIVTWREQEQPCANLAPDDVFVCDSSELEYILPIIESTTFSVTLPPEPMGINGQSAQFIYGLGMSVIYVSDSHNVTIVDNADVIFLYKKVATGTTTPSDFKTFKPYAVASGELPNLINAPTFLAIGDNFGIITPNPNQRPLIHDRKVCASGVNLDSVIPNFVGKNYLLANNTYQLAAYVKIQGYKGSYSTNVQSIVVPDVKPRLSDEPCSDAVFADEAIISNL